MVLMELHIAKMEAWYDFIIGDNFQIATLLSCRSVISNAAPQQMRGTIKQASQLRIR